MGLDLLRQLKWRRVLTFAVNRADAGKITESALYQAVIPLKSASESATEI